MIFKFELENLNRKAMEVSVDFDGRICVSDFMSCNLRLLVDSVVV
jgi:hypothetical protein